ncbi:MAG TPA: NADH:flavin oxidoreductase [Candidatus Aminicenantes bacterium]|nr:NADH:flavin oxidoreductase [Candidatus Aminicenantes bacterium]HRY65289.1 NADH:flavin oxidoreductase [Candidatus Aminicenantes bacterium]HRZ72243.1 NADH:flavin oxidoreductase [Candidatus Aminicenantes bacterium]
MSILFTPVRIGGLVVPNRFVRSATHDYMADDEGRVTDANVALFSRLAEGEVGLIVTGHAFVRPSGKASPRQIAVCSDRFIEGLARIPAAVHGFPSRVFLQIAHAGRQTKPRLCGGVPVSPSAVYDPVSKVRPRELAREEIPALVSDFVAAARRAQRAGFDGVQLHAAHGYLISSFLSPHTNRRTDEWGGPVGNRARILLEVLGGVKSACGASFPVIVKLNSTDLMEGGLTLDDAIAVARLLDANGIDGIEVSGGMAEAGLGSMWPGLRREEDEGYFVDAAARIKQAVRVPVFGLGGIRTLAAAERMVADGRVDLVSLSRPLIRDPFLVRNFREGRAARSGCVSCNKCQSLRGIRCAGPKEL